MKAILTHFVGPTNFRDSRIVAEDCDHRVILSIDHADDDETRHRKAAEELIRRHYNEDWHTGIRGKFKLVSGGTKRGYCFVWVEGDLGSQPS
jgi:hypothetical protein